MEPKYELGQTVRQKHFKQGRVTERKTTGEYNYYKVAFAKFCAWIPEKDLLPAVNDAADA